MQKELQNYKVNATGWCAGERVKRDQTIRLSHAQAKYENVTLIPAKSDKKTKAKSATDKLAG